MRKKSIYYRKGKKMERKMTVDKIKTEKDKEHESIAISISVVSIVANIILAVLKLAAGIIAHSGAMISDAVHSASDVFSTFVVIGGVKMAGKAEDSDHPYGHDRLESVAAIILAAALAVTGAGIGIAGIRSIINSKEIVMPGVLALIAAIVSIVVKEAMYWYTRNGAKKIGSDALMADAWHHRSDALSSVGSFIGIGGAMLGYPILDPLASVIICIFILKVAADIFKEAINKMIDKSCDEEVENLMRRMVLSHEDIISLDLIRTRMFGSKVYVDIEFSADGNMTLYEAHAIAEHIHDEMEEKFPDVKHCMVHVNPVEADHSVAKEHFVTEEAKTGKSVRYIDK